MGGFMQAVQNVQYVLQKTMAEGELLLLDQQMTDRKKLFGVELWDLIHSLEEKHRVEIIKIPDIIKDTIGVEAKIKDQLESCRKDMLLITGDIAKKREALYQLPRSTDPVSKVASAGNEAKLKLEITALEIDAKFRKEKFGLEVSDILLQPASALEAFEEETKKEYESPLDTVIGGVEGICCGALSGIASTVGQLSADERAIQACVDKFRKDMQATKLYKESKQSKMGR